MKYRFAYTNLHFQCIGAGQRVQQGNQHPEERKCQLQALLIVVVLVSRYPFANPRN